MNRFVIAAALAVALGLGLSTRVDAQIVYAYSVPTVNGVETTGTTITPWGTQTSTSFFNPFTGASVGQTYTTNGLGMGYSQTYGYNPFVGSRYGTSFYNPLTGTSGGQTYTTNVLGMGFGQTYGYNPYLSRYATGLYQSNTYVNPILGTSYNTGFYPSNYYVYPGLGVRYNSGVIRRR